MTPAGIDLKIVDRKLQLVSSSLADLRALPQSDLAEFTSDRRNPLAADAALRRALEALFDLGRHLLAKGFGQGSLEYRDVAAQLAAHGLVTVPAVANVVREMAGYRNRLTHHYDEVTPEELYSIVTGHLPDIETAARELGQAAARLAKAETRRSDMPDTVG